MSPNTTTTTNTTTKPPPLLLLLALLAAAACTAGRPPVAAPPLRDPPPAHEATVPPAAAVELQRPLPPPVTPPPEYAGAIRRGTRTGVGRPGPAYWQQWADYRIAARVDTDARTLTGSQTVRYRNASPDTLPALVLNLAQNFHAEGAVRVREAEVTGGVEIERVAVAGQELGPTTGGTPGFLVDGTLMFVVLPRPVVPGGAVEVAVDWSFPLPQSGAGGRMGYSGDRLFFLAYWYPHLAVYDDVAGWHVEPFRGNAEFYSGFASYDLTIDAPAGWLVRSTGRLLNEDEVLRPEVIERLRRAESSDEVVRVVDHGESGGATLPGESGRLRWRFHADSVRDVAFALMRDFAWDAARAPVGDRTGDDATDYTRVDAHWREHARFWAEAAHYALHAIDFLSRYTGLPYPWPHMTSVEGGGIIGGGMEYPMMTLIGDYNDRGPNPLYHVTAHELAHMWIPMILSSNERRYAWFDEGATTFNENMARMEFLPGRNHHAEDQLSYTQLARFGIEGPIMRWSDFHYPGPAYGTASYSKPASVLTALRGMLGEETFDRAWREFMRRWAFKHPYPWDLFGTFEDVAGRDLGWFWRSWYYESADDGPWYLDQAVADVERLADGSTRVTIRDLGWVPMPVHLRVTRADGRVENRVVPVDHWLAGAIETVVTLPPGARVIRIEIDPDQHFPDVDRSNNIWTRR